MKYIYTKDGIYINSTFDEIPNEIIKEQFKDCFITKKYIHYPKIQDNELKEMTQEEIQKYKYTEYTKNNYQPTTEEIIQDNKIFSPKLEEYEKIVNNKIIYDYERKREKLLSDTKIYEDTAKEKAFTFKGYVQPNRELEDQTSLLKIIAMLQSTKQTKFDNWKMKDTEGHEHYISLTIQELMQLALMMQTQTTNTMKKWSGIREQIKKLPNESLKNMEVNEDGLYSTVQG